MYIVTFTTLWGNSTDNNLVIFFLFFQKKTGLDISCILSPLETICMKCQIQFLEEKNTRQHFVQIVFIGDNLHEMSNPVFWEK